MKVWRLEKQYSVLFFSQSVQSGTEGVALGRQADSMQDGVEADGRFCHFDQNSKFDL